MVKGRARARKAPERFFRRDFPGNSRRPGYFCGGRVKKGPGNPIYVMSAQKAAARGTSRHDTALQQRRGRPAPARHPDTTAAGSRAAGGTGPGVPLSIWPGLPAPGDARDGLPCGGPVTVAAARRVIDAFSLPGDLVAAAGGSPAVIEAAAAAGRPVLALIPGPAPARQRPGVPAALPPPGDPAAGTAGLAVAGCCGPGCCGRQPGGGAGAAGPGPGVCRLRAGTAPRRGPRGHHRPRRPRRRDRRYRRERRRRRPCAGPGLRQHIVLVRAAIDGDRLAPAAPDPGPAAPGGSPVHDDLLVFTKPGGGARS